jgi:alcohol dehydrogenase
VKAAILRQSGLPRPYAESKPLAIDEVSLEGPRDGEVLVEVKAAGLCHSDLSVIDGARPRPVPMAIGHEGAGIVREVGPGVRDLSPGDHVVMVFVPSCGSCVPCASGRPALCEPGAAANGAGTLLGGERRLSKDGQPIHHHLGVSCFAEQAVLSRRSLIKIDPSLPFDRAALFGCAVLTGVGAVVTTAHVPAGATVAVVGLGGVGLNAILGALLVGAGRVVGVDLSPAKRTLAKEMGATDVFDANADAIREATGGGVDFAFEMAGSVQALELAYKITRRGGTTVTAGLSHPSQMLSIPHVSLVAEERTLKGSYIGSAVPARDIPRYIALMQQGRLRVDRVVSDRISLEAINGALDRLDRGDAVRQVICF